MLFHHKFCWIFYWLLIFCAFSLFFLTSNLFSYVCPLLITTVKRNPTNCCTFLIHRFTHAGRSVWRFLLTDQLIRRKQSKEIYSIQLHARKCQVPVVAFRKCFVQDFQDDMDTYIFDCGIYSMSHKRWPVLDNQSLIMFEDFEGIKVNNPG
jgi:hypothetical protein